VGRVDAATIDAARRGDRRALARVLSDLQDVWYRFCLGLLHDPDRAADATQETGLRFLKQIAGFRGDSQLQTWSLGIALNVVREHKRKRPTEEMTGVQEPVAATPRVARLIESQEEALMLSQTLQTLPDRQREAITLRFFEDLSVEETAHVMGCATGTVKATVHQALRALREKLKQLK
jgi:RNA polymerase sigma-70 factor (ECF subfamily)